VGSDVISSNSRADEDAIRAVIDRQVRAWAASDPEAYASVFTPDADYVTFLGSHHKGRAAIAGSYAKLFKKITKGSQLDLGSPRLRFVSPDVALIHSEYTVVKGRRRLNAGVNTTVAVRTDGGWFFAASQSTKHRRFAEKLMGIFDSRTVRSPVADQ
jgi:uncharacterized protein (TIGR02246 family)